MRCGMYGPLLVVLMLSFLGPSYPFNAYLEGVKRIGAVPGSILSSIEPISAAFFGWALFRQSI